MRKTRFLITILIAVFAFSKSYAAFHQNDSARIANFLTQQSATVGTPNAQQLNVDANDPETWHFTTWTDANPKRLLTVRMPSKNLAGSLNLQNCDSLKVVNFNHNSISQLNLTGCTKLDTLTFSNNRLESIDLSNCTLLRYLDCDNNLIAHLNITYLTNLQTLKCRHNNLTFFELLLPMTNDIPAKVNIPAGGCLIGEQRPYRPAEVTIFNTRNVSKGFSIDLAILNANDFRWRYRSETAKDGDPVTNFTRVGDRFIFNTNLLRDTIYCIMRNETTHPTMVVPTVAFELSYKYNANDLSKLQQFLNSWSSNPIVRNGNAITSDFVLTDPTTFRVNWEPATVGSETEYRFVEIYQDWANKGLAGVLDLTGCDSLRRIIVNNNELTGFVFSNSTNVNYFELSNNPAISELNLAPHKKLLQLFCANNSLTELDLTHNTALVNLYCNDNEITKLVGISGLKSLRILECQNNELTELNLSGLTQLRILNCDNNDIEFLGTGNLMALELLDANNNRIKNVDLEASIPLKKVSIRNNELVSLNLKGLESITHLHCENNKLNFKTLVMPEKMPIHENFLHPQDTVYPDELFRIGNEWVSEGIEIDMTPFSNSSTLFAWMKYNGEDEDELIELTDEAVFEIPAEFIGATIYCTFTSPTHPNLELLTPKFRAEHKYHQHDVAKLRTFLDEFSKFGNVLNGRTNGREITVNYKSEDPTTFPVEWIIKNGVKRLHRINWYNQSNLKGKLDLEGCAALDIINISCESNLRRNAIHALNLNGCTDLRIAKAQFNQLETVSFNNCEKIVELDVSSNVIESTFAIHSKEITNLNISNNRIPTMVLNGFPKLKNLDISHNLLSGTLNLAGNAALVEVNCSYNKFTNLNLTDNINITNLNASNNSLSTVNLANQKLLQVLFIDNNNLNTLDISHNIELAALSCRHNNLTALNFAGVNYVTYLHASHNKLNFTSIKYDKIPNELSLHPQAEISLNTQLIDTIARVLINGTLDLRGVAEIEDSVTVYIFRYLDRTPVPSHLVFPNTTEKGVFTFDDELKGRTIFAEMTNTKFPGLTLVTARFNTAAPDKYNENDSMRLRAFLDAQSKTSGFSNGRILTNNTDNNYNSSSPETYPVDWENMNGEFRVTNISWINPNLNGELNLTNCEFLESLTITGQTNNSGVNRLILDGCSSLTYLDCSFNSLQTLTLTNLTHLDFVNCSHNIINNLAFNNSNFVKYLNCSYNKLSALNVQNLNLLFDFDCSNNALTFATLALSNVRPEIFIFNPQAEVVPLGVIYSNYQYVLLDQEYVNLTEFGAADIYELFLESGELIWSGGTGYINLGDWFGEIVYCRMSSTQGKFAGCTLRTVRFLIDSTSSISEDFANLGINIYPNPANDFATISLENLETVNNLEITIFDISGANLGIIYSGNFTDNIRFSTNHLPVGVYYLQLKVADKQLIKMLNIQR